MNFNKQIDDLQNNIIEETRNLVKIRSYRMPPEEDMPYGKGINDALEYVLNLGKEMGFVTKRIDGYCGYIEYGESDIYVGIFAHIDVNEEFTEDWRFAPYEAIIHKNRIYGSCVIDKGALIAALYALKTIKESGCKLKKKVRIVIGTDERRHYEDMQSYLSHETLPITGFATDGLFPVTYVEKGLGMFEYCINISQNNKEYIECIKGGKSDNLVPGYCCAKIHTKDPNQMLTRIDQYSELNRHDINAKIENDIVIAEVFGKERHCAFIERGINSISIMLDLLRTLNFGSDDLKNNLDFLCKKIGFDIYGEALGTSYEDELSGKNTINLGTIDFKNNTLTLRFDCRFAVTSNYYQVIEVLNSIFTNAGYTINESTYWAPTYFPERHFLIQELLEAYRDITGDKRPPMASSNGSYSKVLPNIAAFGAFFPGDIMMWDQADEFLEINALLKTTKIYANAIYRIASEL